LQRLFDHCVVDREKAGLNVYLCNWLAIDRHLEPVGLRQTLVAIFSAAVEASTFLPRQVVEHALIAVVFTTQYLKAQQEVVQFADVRFKTLGLWRIEGRVLVFDPSSALAVFPLTDCVVFQD
jgi:hypothetical protein